MAGQGLSFDVKSLQGYDALQRRFAALGKVDAVLLSGLGQAANREQKSLLYTQAIKRKTGFTGSQITVEAQTALSVLTVARGLAALADTGTRAHIIRPKPGRIGRHGRPAALAWGGPRTLGGRLRVTGGVQAMPTDFARFVHHPGTRPHPYMLRGAQMAIEKAGLVGKVIAVWNSAA